MAKAKKLLEVDFTQTEVVAKGSRRNERVEGARDLAMPGSVAIDMGAGNDDVSLTLTGRLPEKTTDPDAPNAELAPQSEEETTKPGLPPLIISGGRNGTAGMGDRGWGFFGGGKDTLTLNFSTYDGDELTIESVDYRDAREEEPVVYVKAAGVVIAELRGFEMLTLTDADGDTRSFTSKNVMWNNGKLANTPMKEITRAA